MVATGSEDHTLRIWDFEKQVVHPLDGRDWVLPRPWFSPDGEWVIADTGDGYLRLFHTLTAESRAEFHLESPLAAEPAFSNDSLTFCVGCTNGEILVFSLPEGNLKATFSGHQGFVIDLSFSSDGLQLASIASDKTVRLWDVKSGKELSRFAVETEQAIGLVFSPDMQQIILGNRDGIVEFRNSKAVEKGKILSCGFEIQQFDVSRDGQKVIFETVSGETWEIEMESEKTKKLAQGRGNLKAFAEHYSYVILAEGDRDLVLRAGDGKILGAFPPGPFGSGSDGRFFAFGVGNHLLVFSIPVL